MYLKRTNLLIFIFLTITMSTSCWFDKGKNIPVVSNIEINFKIDRFEQDLMSLDTSQWTSEFNRLKEKYPVFLPEVYLSKILPALQDPNVFELFVKSEEVRQLYDACMVNYKDMEDIEKELKLAMQFYKYYFPNRPTPRIITYISEYSLGAFTYDGMLGIGLDFFLGKDYPLYNPMFFPNYIKRSMNREHLIAKAIEVLTNDLVGPAHGDQLLDMMVNNGKVLYVMDQLLPYAPDSIKLSYTSTQTQWVADNELQIWSYFIGEDLLYSARKKDIRKLVEHSPNAPGMPPEAPGRTANWIGWQIIKSFMKRHPDLTLEELIATKSAQKILDQSKYKPGR